MGGDEITTYPDGSWIKDIIQFKCDKWEFRFRQRPDVAHGKTGPLKGTNCETSTVEVEGVEPNQVDKVLEALDAICWLLSFASQSRIARYGYHFPDTTTGQFRATAGTVNDFRPPINLRDTEVIKSFIEQTYPEYRRLSKKRKLTVIFDYLEQTERHNQPTEVRLLLLFVTLESLKDTYARELGIPYIKGFYRKPPTKPNSPGAKYGFEELLLKMLRSVGMRKGLKQVVTLRNEIIHSGLSRKSHSRQWQIHERIQDLVREYVFRLLNYRGEFFTYTSQGMGVKKI
jgi:hypothetical protein